MIVPCPECKTRFKLDPATVPAGGVRFRCGRCRKLFRMTVRYKNPPAARAQAAPVPAQPASTTLRQAPEPVVSVPVAAPAEPWREAVPVQSREEASPGTPAVRPLSPAPVPDAPTRIPTPRSQELAHVTDIQRVARVAVSDLELYDARRVESSILTGKFLQEFRGDLDETRRLVRVRHRDVPDAVGLFDRTLEALCEQRRLKALATK